MLAALGVDGDSRLVEKDEFWLMSDATSDIETTKKAAGELFRIELAEISQTDELDRVIDAFFALGFVFNVEAAEKVDVVLGAEFVEYGDILENDANLALQIVGSRGHCLAEDFDGSLVKLEQREKTVNCGRFTGAVRAEETEDLAFFYIEGEAVDGFEGGVGFGVFVGFGEMTDFDDVGF